MISPTVLLAMSLTDPQSCRELASCSVNDTPGMLHRMLCRASELCASSNRCKNEPSHCASFNSSCFAGALNERSLASAAGSWLIAQLKF